MTETTWLVRERRVVSRKINWPGNSRFYLSICHYFYLSLNQTGDLSFFSWCFTWEALLCRYPSSCPLWNDKIIFSSVRENVRSRCLIPPSTSACLGNRTLRSHPPKDIFHVPDFSRGMLHSGYLVYLSIIHMLIQEIFIFNTNKVNPTFLTQVVFNPAAEMNMCTWQDRYHGDCTDKILSSEYSSACSLGHWRPRRLQEGNFWEERELSSGHSPGWCAKTLDRLGLSWLWPESKQKKKKKPLAMRIVCEHLGEDRAPRIWATGRKLLLLGIVYFWKQENSKLAVYAQWGKWRKVVNITQSCYRSILTLNFRAELSLALGNKMSVASQCLELCYNQGSPISQEEGAYSPPRKHDSCLTFRWRKTAMVTHF